MKISKAFLKALNSQHKFLVLYGGAGSGKSVFATQKIIARLMSETPHKFLVIRKVGTTLRNSVWDLFLKIIADEGLDELFETNKSNFEITCKLNGNKVLFKGLDNPEKIKSIADITSIWIEEATELNAEDLDQLELRLRGKTKNYKQFIITFNPVSAHHWIKKRFFDVVDDNVLTLKSTYLDNPFIDSEYRQTFERLKRDNPNYYKIYALGEWGSLQGIIYPDWDVVKEMPQFFEDEYIGIDFGYNHAYAVVHVRVKENELYVDELFYKRGYENRAVIEEIEKKYPFVKNLTLFADSARPDLISEWLSSGYNIHKANKSVFDGINTVKSFKLFITSRSDNIKKELGLYAWREDKDGNLLDEPEKCNDDAMDAMRYALTPYIERRTKHDSGFLEWL